MKTYSINEIFYSIQGEGYYAGTPTIFVRFSGCNLWGGNPENRERDSLKNEAACPRWCDTDFAKGVKMNATEIVEKMVGTLQGSDVLVSDWQHIVFTGGEPMLQLTPELVSAIHSRFKNANVAIETNGTLAIPAGLVDWITVSPKTAPEKVVQRTGNELKVVYPGGAMSPNGYRDALGPFGQLYVSPLAEVQPGPAGRSLLDFDNLQQALAYVLQNNGWKLSVQTHKVVGAR